MQQQEKIDLGVLTPFEQGGQWSDVEFGQHGFPGLVSDIGALIAELRAYRGNYPGEAALRIELNYVKDELRASRRMGEKLRSVVDEAAKREHGVGYDSKRKGRRCNLVKIQGCIYCRALAELEALK